MKVQNNGDAIQSSKEVGAVLAAYRKSGLGLRRFAREHHIPPGRLHYWIYQKHRHARSQARARTSDPPARFQEVKLGVGSPLMESWAAEVRLADGVNIRFSRTATPAWIGAVVAVLRRPC